jgi:hypothetical protein
MMASATLPGIHYREYGVLGRSATSVRKLTGMAAAIVRLPEFPEPPDPDRHPAFEERPRDAVHAVHDALTGL